MKRVNAKSPPHINETDYTYISPILDFYDCNVVYPFAEYSVILIVLRQIVLLSFWESELRFLIRQPSKDYSEIIS